MVDGGVGGGPAQGALVDVDRARVGAAGVVVRSADGHRDGVAAQEIARAADRPAKGVPGEGAAQDRGVGQVAARSARAAVDDVGGPVVGGPQVRPRRADDEVVDAVIVEVAGGGHREAEPVLVGHAAESQTGRARQARAAVEHVHASGQGCGQAAGRGAHRPVGPSVVVHVADGGHAEAELLAAGAAPDPVRRRQQAAPPAPHEDRTGVGAPDVGARGPHQKLPAAVAVQILQFMDRRAEKSSGDAVGHVRQVDCSGGGRNQPQQHQGRERQDGMGVAWGMTRHDRTSASARFAGSGGGFPAGKPPRTGELHGFRGS